VGSSSGPVHLVVPVKALHAAKSRLRGAADRGVGEPAAHSRLALALAHDTVAAARAAAAVAGLVVVSSDPVVAAGFAAVGVEVVAEAGTGLNAACAQGARVLRERHPGSAVGALQADLPALRPEELDAAVADGLAAGPRAFCADAAGSGTTFLLAAPGAALDPRFGVGSARRHRASGAVALGGVRPGLRRDVDTADDLCAAAALGVGARTGAVLAVAGGRPGEKGGAPRHLRCGAPQHAPATAAGPPVGGPQSPRG
jgi:2-phospho-L-lactate/phosphoenolpyruvate guanylyltransferase